MPSLIDIRRRIRSVKNTQQITKAMKMVSAAKLRRAQERVISARPYASLLRQMLANVVAAVQSGEEGVSNPLLTVRPEKRIELLLITAERQQINQLFRSGRLKDEGRRRIERDLDLREAHLANQRAEE